MIYDYLSCTSNTPTSKGTRLFLPVQKKRKNWRLEDSWEWIKDGKYVNPRQNTNHYSEWQAKHFQRYSREIANIKSDALTP